MKITGSLIVIVAAGAFAAGALILNPDPAPAPTATVAAGAISASPEIDIQGFGFNAVTAAPGQTVTVRNFDQVEHTVSATDGSFDSGVVGAGAAVSFIAPSTPGVYTFICQIHPSMSGQLTVAAA